MKILIELVNEEVETRIERFKQKVQEISEDFVQNSMR